MYVCVCKAITEDRLQQEIKKGKSPGEIEKFVCTGADCGTCLVFAKQKIEELYNQIKPHSLKSAKNKLS